MMAFVLYRGNNQFTDCVAFAAIILQGRASFILTTSLHLSIESARRSPVSWGIARTALILTISKNRTNLSAKDFSLQAFYLGVEF